MVLAMATTFSRKPTSSELEILHIPSWISGPIDLIGTIVFWAVTGFFGLWVLSKFFGNLKALREE